MKKFIIVKDYKSLKKGQEIELTEEMAAIFTKIGIISNGKEPKVEVKMEENAIENKAEKVIKSNKKNK